jgi:hypothetical protein
MAIDLNQLIANPELSGFERQRKMAQMLVQQGMQAPQAQMVGDRYVPANPLQYAGNLFNVYAGQKNLENVDQQELAYAKALRQKEIEDLTKFSELQYGTPEQEANPMAAFQLGAQSTNPLVRSQLAEMLKGQKLSEGDVFQRYNPATGKTDTIGQGTAKYRAPIQIDTGTAIELRDPLDPTKVLQRVPKAIAPTAGQVLETENGPMLVNTRTGQAQPIMANGQPVVGGKPLTEAQGNATAFGMRAKQSNELLTNLEAKGVKDTGVTRSAISSTVGMTPFIGEKLEQGVSSAMNVLPTYLGGPSENQQSTDQARRNFVTAVLRKESGAVISPSEFAGEAQKYFPQPGDTTKVIKQKQEARELAIKALEIQAGPGAKYIKEPTAPKKVVNFNDLP